MSNVVLEFSFGNNLFVRPAQAVSCQVKPSTEGYDDADLWRFNLTNCLACLVEDWPRWYIAKPERQSTVIAIQIKPSATYNRQNISELGQLP